jgi:hypothetical protein
MDPGFRRDDGLLSFRQGAARSAAAAEAVRCRRVGDPGRSIKHLCDRCFEGSNWYRSIDRDRLAKRFDALDCVHGLRRKV